MIEIEDKKYKFKFSVVTPIYNVEQYLEETIKSVINQTIGFKKNIQIILINDGSPDNSEKICLKYKDKYPENIIYIKQKNSGVSVARNNGLKHIEGKYVNFLDSDDLWTKNTFKKVWSFFELHESEVDVVACRLKFFGLKKGYQILDYKFDKEKVVDIGEQFDHIILSAPSTFIKSTEVKKLEFDKRLKYGEDSVYINKIILKKKKYGIVPQCTYLYRKRLGENSAVDTAVNKNHYYNESIDYYLLELKKYSISKLGYYCKYIQALVLYDIMWRVRASLSYDVLDTEDKRNSYFNKIKNLIKEIDDDVIVCLPIMDVQYKIYFLLLKNGKSIYKDIKIDGKYLLYKGYRINSKPIINIVYKKISADNEYINLYAKVAFFLPKPEPDKFEVKDLITGEVYTPEIFQVKTLNQFSCNGDVISYGYLFYLRIPRKKRYILEHNIYLNDKYMSSGVVFSKNYGMSNKYKSYTTIDGKVIIDRLNGNIRISKLGLFTLLKKYVLCLLDLLVKKKLRTFLKKAFGFAFNFIFDLYERLRLKKVIILESNPVYTGNVKEVFDYMIKQGVNEEYKIVWFTNAKEELPDVHYNNVEFLEFFNMKNAQRSKYVKRLYKRAKIIIDSNKYLNKKNKHQIRIHLNHGSPFKNAISYNLSIGDVDYDICQSSFFREVESKVRDIDIQKILPLGFPRNDILYSNEKPKLEILSKFEREKIIFWLPTYRVHNTTSGSKSNLKYGLACIENEKELIMVNDTLKKNNVVLLIKFHPAEKVEVFEKLNLSNIVLLKDVDLENANIPLNGLFPAVDALITDYSSVYFDFCLTKKNIGLAISDYDDYIKEQGEFQYPYKDVIIGNYMYNNADLLEFIKDVATGKDRTYKDRMKLIKQYDDYQDGKSTERIYEFIKKFL